jgi:hypothetical protein
VQRARKFSAVLGTTSAKSYQVAKKEESELQDMGQGSKLKQTSKTMRPAALPSIVTSKKTLGLDMMIESRNNGMIIVWLRCPEFTTLP